MLPVVIQVSVLLSAEVTNTHSGVNPPSVQELVPDFRDCHQFLIVGKRDVAFVKEMINLRRQQKAIGAI